MANRPIKKTVREAHFLFLNDTQKIQKIQANSQREIYKKTVGLNLY